MTHRFHRARVACFSALVLFGSTVAHAGSAPGGNIDYGPVAVAGVPTLGEWTLVLLSLLTAVIAYRALRGRVNGRLMSNMVLAGAAVAAGFAGHGVVQQAQAMSWTDVDLTSPTGGSVHGTWLTRLNNTSGVPLKILAIHLDPYSMINSPISETPECTVGLVVAPATSCFIDFVTPGS